MEERKEQSPARRRLIAAAPAVGTVLGVAGVAGAVTDRADETSTESSTTAQVDDDNTDVVGDDVESDDADGRAGGEEADDEYGTHGDHDGDRDRDGGSDADGDTTGAMADETPLDGVWPTR